MVKEETKKPKAKKVTKKTEEKKKTTTAKTKTTTKKTTQTKTTQPTTKKTTIKKKEEKKITPKKAPTKKVVKKELVEKVKEPVIAKKELIGKNKDRRKGIILFILFAVLSIILLTSFAILTYTKNGKTKNIIKSGAINFIYNEGKKRISLNNALPMSDAEGKSQNNYFEFEIKSENTYNEDIRYTIATQKQGNIANRIDSTLIKIYLTKVNDNNTETPLLLTTYDKTETFERNGHLEEVLYKDTVSSHTEKYYRKYRLRMWIDESANISPIKVNNQIIYPLNNKEFNLTVNVYTLDLSGYADIRSFSFDGPCIFNGRSGNITGDNCSKYHNTNYIDTGIKLYSRDTYQDDYEISFNVDEYSQSNQDNIDNNQATLMSAKSEKYEYRSTGIAYRQGTNNTLQISQNINGSITAKTNPASTVRKVKIVRKNSLIFYSINDGEYTFLKSTSNQSYFIDNTLIFGAAKDSDENPFRLFRGTLSNMKAKRAKINDRVVTILDGNGYNYSKYYLNEINTSYSNILPKLNRPGFTFSGWYTQKNGGEKIDENMQATTDRTLYAHWNSNECIITYNVNGGEEIAETYLNGGDKLNNLPVPIKPHYAFEGWYYDKNLTRPVNSNDTITSSLTLYAKWNYNITLTTKYELNGTCVFNGKDNSVSGDCATDAGLDYVDTGVSLFTSTTYDKDFEIYFEITSYDFTTPNDTGEQRTFVSSKYEIESLGYPGFVFRQEKNKSNAELTSGAGSGSEKKTIIFSMADIHTVKISRINKKLYYSIDGADLKFFQDNTNFINYFNDTVTFGAARKSDGTMFRYFKGELSNMYIKTQD